MLVRNSQIIPKSRKKPAHVFVYIMLYKVVCLVTPALLLSIILVSFIFRSQNFLEYIPYRHYPSQKNPEPLMPGMHSLSGWMSWKPTLVRMSTCLRMVETGTMGLYFSMFQILGCNSRNTV